MQRETFNIVFTRVQFQPLLEKEFVLTSLRNNYKELSTLESWLLGCIYKNIASSSNQISLIGSQLYSCAKNIRHTALCTHHLIFFGGVSSSIPKLEHGGEVASVAAAASRKKKRLVGLWKVASECRGSLLRSTIRLLVDGGCNAEAAVKHTGTISGKLIRRY